jgi:hypothetical protein
LNSTRPMHIRCQAAAAAEAGNLCWQAVFGLVSCCCCQVATQILCGSIRHHGALASAGRIAEHSTGSWRGSQQQFRLLWRLLAAVC